MPVTSKPKGAQLLFCIWFLEFYIRSNQSSIKFSINKLNLFYFIYINAGIQVDYKQ